MRKIGRLLLWSSFMHSNAYFCRCPVKDKGGVFTLCVYGTLTQNVYILDEHQVLNDALHRPPVGNLFSPLPVLYHKFSQPYYRFQTTTGLLCCSFENHSTFSLLPFASLLLTVFVIQHHLSILHSFLFHRSWFPVHPHKTPTVQSFSYTIYSFLLDFCCNLLKLWWKLHDIKFTVNNF